MAIRTTALPQVSSLIELIGHDAEGRTSRATVTDLMADSAWLSLERAGDGATVSFSLDELGETGSVAALIVAIDGVVQATGAYTIVDNALTFGEAPPNGAVIDIRLTTVADVGWTGTPTLTMTVAEYNAADIQAGIVYAVEPAVVETVNDLPDPLFDDRWDGIELSVTSPNLKLYRCLPDGAGDRAWVAVGAVSADTPTFTGTTTAEALKVGTMTYFQEVDGDAWWTVNAYHDGADWQRVDITKPAWGMQVNVATLMVYESYEAITMWTAQPAANPISPVWASVGGWEMVYSYSRHRNQTTGGGGCEYDGFGAVDHHGYGRFQHAKVSGVTYTGIVGNQFLDFSGRDSTSLPSWRAGIENNGTTSKFAVAYGAAGGVWPGWTELMAVSSDGNLSATGTVGGTSFRPGNGSVLWTSGAGTPEGVVSAPVGSLFTRTDGSTSTTLYVKTGGGSGNTGWTAK